MTRAVAVSRCGVAMPAARAKACTAVRMPSISGGRLRSKSCSIDDLCGEARSLAVGALDRDLGGDAVRPRRGETFRHQCLGEGEQLVVPANDPDRLAGQRADRAGAEVAQQLVPDLDTNIGAD